MFVIRDLIEERQKYALGVNKDPLGDELLSHIVASAPENEVAFITIGSTLFDKRKIKAIQEKYHIIGTYKIGRIFNETAIPFYIVHLSKAIPAGLRIALFHGKGYNPHSPAKNTDEFTVPDSYPIEWVKYINRLEAWMNGAEMPECDQLCEYRFIPVSKLYKENYNPEVYSKPNVEMRELLSKQDTKALSELADILSPTAVSENADKAKVLKVRDLKYPLDVSHIETDVPTNIILEKGDIVIPRVNAKTKAYLYNYEGDEKIYADRNLTVIKCRKILPEYLYLYLNSDAAVRISNASYDGVSIPYLRAKEIADLPIVIPTVDNQKYIHDFNKLTNFKIRDYAQPQILKSYYDRLKRILENKEEPEKAEDILNLELADNIRAYNEEQLRSFLSDDLKELNTCFKGKAYKATLILAGSILEAVLIDWLSEIHHKDYFEEDYIVIDRDGREKRADLIDYINEIKYLQRPHWMKEAEKAHAIRKKRNLVHARLCMKSDDINEAVCREVTSYLSDVLATRGVHSKSE